MLQWDQETYLPPKGSDIRGRQIATLSELAHDQFTSDKLGGLLQELAATDQLTDTEKKNATLTLEDYNRNKKFTGSFVRQMSETTNKTFHAWIEARKKNDFAVFQQPLNELIQLKKQEADILGYEHHPYNALMNDYDKGLTVSIVDKLFADIKPKLQELLSAIQRKPLIDDSILHQHFEKNAQWEFGIELLKRMNFNFEAGRQDISEHPFTTNFNNKDVRVTTRIDEHNLANMTWSCIHEGGHALYEQGLPTEQYGLPLSEACSLSIHESQSRFWENCIGRGLSFWQHNLPLAQQLFENQLGNITPAAFYNVINKVEPSLIRTEADELTYHFHIMIRYEIEKMLIDGSIQIKDVPAYWNQHYEKYLGIKVPDDKRGCLQDVHWSHGSFGYFATYSLGSMYAAQLYASMQKENDSLEKEITDGKMAFIHGWLGDKIYQYGRYYTSEELCAKATGETLNANYFTEYVVKKYTGIYSL